MSELLARIKQDITLARKAREKKKIRLLGLVVGEVGTITFSPSFKGEVTDGIVVKVLKKIVKANLETMDLATKNYKKHESSNARLSESDDLLLVTNEHNGLLIEENKLLEMYLPPEWSKAQIREELIKVVVPNMDIHFVNEGIAIGLAIRHFKTIDGIQDGKLISEAVRELRREYGG